MNNWAHIVLWDDVPANERRFIRENGREKLTICFCGSLEEAINEARNLVENGTTLIEICGGFGAEGAARLQAAVGNDCAVGHVVFDIASIAQAAAYKARFEQNTSPF